MPTKWLLKGPAIASKVVVVVAVKAVAGAACALAVFHFGIAPDALGLISHMTV